jgi:hypothetical protein
LNNIKKITCPRRILVECLSTQKKSGKNPNCKNILIHELTLSLLIPTIAVFMETEKAIRKEGTEAA